MLNSSWKHNGIPLRMLKKNCRISWFHFHWMTKILLNLKANRNRKGFHNNFLRGIPINWLHTSSYPQPANFIHPVEVSLGICIHLLQERVVVQQEYKMSWKSKEGKIFSPSQVKSPRMFQISLSNNQTPQLFWSLWLFAECG